MLKAVAIIFFLLIGTLGFAAELDPPAVNNAGTYKVQEWIEINKNILSLIHQARQDFQDGNYPASVGNYEKVLKLNAADTRVKEAYQQALKAQEAVQRLTNSYQSSNYAETLAALKDLEKLNPRDTAYAELQDHSQNIEKLNAKAAELYKKAKYNETIEQYSVVLKINPEDKFAANNIEKIRNLLTWKKNAAQYFVAGDYTNAREQYQKILIKNPNDQFAQTGINNCDSALQYIAQADNSISKSDFNNAFTYLNKVVELNPEDNTTYQRTVDYKKIIDYYQTNQQMLRASCYPELLFNYQKMLQVLQNNEKLLAEKQKYAECLTLKTKAYSRFASENYQEALRNFKKIVLANPQDELASQNIVIIQKAITRQGQAQAFYLNGEYQKSLEIYNTLAKVYLFKEEYLKPEWKFYQGQLNNFVLTLPHTGTTAASIVFNGQRPIKLNPADGDSQTWTGTVNIPLTELEGYKLAKLYLKNDSDKTRLVFATYLIEANKITAPSGYSINEKDLAL